MPTIQDQLKLERRMMSTGIAKYRSSVRKAEEDARGKDTAYAQRLLQSFVVPVSECITEFVNTKAAGDLGKHKRLLRMVNPAEAAFIGLSCLFTNFIMGTGLQHLANQIGTRIEDELKFSMFQDAHGDYYNTILQDFKNKGTKSYRHMHRVLTMKANEKQVQWVAWTLEDKVAVGTKIVDCIMQSTDLIEKGHERSKNKIKDKTVIRPTEQALEWVKNFNANTELLFPDRLPCIIPPDPWIAYDQGGYYTPQLRSTTKLVKTRSRTHAKMFHAGNLSIVMNAVNAIQNTAWKVNTEVLDVMHEVWDKSLGIGLPRTEPYEIPICPLPRDLRKEHMNDEQLELLDHWKQEARMIYAMEKERVGQGFQVARTLRTAREFAGHDKFYYVYQCDFRGRIYCTVSGLSPQGTDFSKSLLTFADSYPITPEGKQWLCIHGANCYGIDKVSFEDRLSWVDEHRQGICDTASDPIGNRDFWGSADKPWQFLAFCFEYARMLREGSSFRTSLPVGLDGTCNGLQHLSALLRDEVGGRATNLIPADKPSDIYAIVAQLATRKAVEGNDPCLATLRAWMSSTALSDLPRGLTKRPVMTLPYGVTKMSARDYILDWLIKDESGVFDITNRGKMASYLTPIVWDSINETVVAARSAMDWLQKSASAISKTNKPIIWWSPVGFPVCQDRKKFKSVQVRTQLCGNIRLRLDKETPEIDPRQQRQGIAPNFIHSMDAAHLMLTVNAMANKGCTSFAVIHDDFGTHCTKVPELYKVLREQFVEMYSNNDPLFDFKKYHEAEYGIKLPDLPSMGSLKLSQVIDSKYFFA